MTNNVYKRQGLQTPGRVIGGKRSKRPQIQTRQVLEQ